MKVIIFTIIMGEAVHLRKYNQKVFLRLKIPFIYMKKVKENYRRTATVLDSETGLITF